MQPIIDNIQTKIDIFKLNNYSTTFNIKLIFKKHRKQKQSKCQKYKQFQSKETLPSNFIP